MSPLLHWIYQMMESVKDDQPVFLFLNIGETHVPYWHEGASWDCWPSPCIPFGGQACSKEESSERKEEISKKPSTNSSMVNIVDLPSQSVMPVVMSTDEE